jgi:threonine dehydratase
MTRSPRALLCEEILRATQTVYQAGSPTPLESLSLARNHTVWLKREDLSPIRAYKWRGAFHRMAALSGSERAAGVVTASAGNHAQGVALAARHLGCQATIYMPLSTPRLKQDSVRRLGEADVTIRLAGDTYHEAYAAAQEDAQTSGRVYIHAFDDPLVMAGQGTLAVEVTRQHPLPFDRVYLQIGGGGMAAAVACWLKEQQPGIIVIGVEGVDQACMQAALEAGHPVTLDKLDVFCDGTAVNRAGDHTFALCRGLIDSYRRVSNDEVSAAMRYLWDHSRFIPEPAGAMGLAALLQDQEQGLNQTGESLVIICGANMDFRQLAVVARHSDNRRHRLTLRLEISERAGSMLDLLLTCFTEGAILDFQYGKIAPDRAWPVITVETGDDEGAALLARLKKHRVPTEVITDATDVDFRAIPFRGDLVIHPLFVQLEFHERAGALRDFLQKTQATHGSLCYFNYSYTGERVGRALIGFEFPDEASRQTFREALGHHGRGYRRLDELGDSVRDRLLAAAPVGRDEGR